MGGKARILHIVGLGTVGGVECLFTEFIDRDPAAGGDAALITRGLNPVFAPGVDRALGQVARVKYLGGIRLPPVDALRVANVRRIIRRLRPDAVLCWSSLPALQWGAEARRYGIPLCYYEHGLSWFAEDEDSRAAIRGADCAIAVSRAATRMLESHVGFTGPTRVVANGLRPGALDAGAGTPEPEPRSGAGLRLGFAGRLTPMKGAPLALQALAALRRHGCHASLDIAGTGSEEAALRELAERLDIAGQVNFHGLVRDMGAFFRGIDLLLVPSLREPFGLVAIEAAANGCPVVASRVDGLPETLIEGVTGVTVAARRSLADYPALGGSLNDIPGRVYDPETDTLRAPGFPDPDHLADAVARLANNRAALHSMAVAGRDMALERFAFPRYIAELRDAVATLTSTRPAAAEAH